MSNKKFRFLANIIIFFLLIASVLLLTFLTPANSQEKSTTTPAPEAKEPAIKAGGGKILPSAKNLSDVKAMVFPQKSLYNHKYHPRSYCGMLEAKLDIAGKYQVDYLTGVIYLKGVVKLKVKMDKKHAGYGLTNGHGVKFYVDGKLFTQNDFLLVKDPTIKDKDAKHEFEDIWEWELDTTRFPDGLHTIAVNVCDHFDHYGVDSFECYIVNKKK